LLREGQARQPAQDAEVPVHRGVERMAAKPAKAASRTGSQEKHHKILLFDI
jgi:hypothetical protein